MSEHGHLVREYAGRTFKFVHVNSVTESDSRRPKDSEDVHNRAARREASTVHDGH